MLYHEVCSLPERHRGPGSTLCHRKGGDKQVNDRDRFDKFTERARKVLSLAQEEAQRFQHNYIGTEHLLLGLVREGEGVAAKVLANLGVELNKVRSAVEFIIGRGDRIVLGEIGLTPRAKKVIELAVDEARRLNHHYIGTEHLLLGLVREGAHTDHSCSQPVWFTPRTRRQALEDANHRSDGYRPDGRSPCRNPRSGDRTPSGDRARHSDFVPAE